MTPEETLNEQVWALRAVLAATEAVEAALAPPNLDAFELALAARAEALQRLEVSVAGGPPGPFGEDAPSIERALVRILRDLAASVREAEERSQHLAQQALDSVRDELRSVQASRSALAGYRPPFHREARFADRRG